MEQITVNIPTGLTAAEELLVIAKELGKKYLPGSSTPLIGTGYELTQLQTVIVVNRVPLEKAVAIFECPVCSVSFTKPTSKICYTNFGGVTKQKRLCSVGCREQFISISPDRISIKNPGYMFHRR